MRNRSVRPSRPRMTYPNLPYVGRTAYRQIVVGASVMAADRFKPSHAMPLRFDRDLHLLSPAELEALRTG